MMTIVTRTVGTGRAEKQANVGVFTTTTTPEAKKEQKNREE